MSKMTLEQKRELLIELCKIRDVIRTDEQLTKTVLRNHLEFIPHKKLYKFRTCCKRNFDTLAENCIWMSPANSFPDPFDNTINIDLKRNSEEIELWLYNNYPVFCFYLAKTYCESKGLSVPYTEKDLIEYANTCLDKDGNPIEEKEKAFWVSRVSPDELLQIESAWEQFKSLRDKFAEKEEVAARCISDVINQMRTRMRDTLLVYCMTERYDNRTLWENYADMYSGFCIEYSFADFDNQSFDDYKNLVFMFPMTYRKRIPYFNMVPFLDGACRQFICNDESWQQNPELDADLNMQLYYKSKDYEFEHEWRFAINNAGNNKQFFPFVSAIYAGKDISAEHLKQLLTIAKELSVPVYCQTINKSGNGFDYNLV